MDDGVERGPLLGREELLEQAGNLLEQAGALKEHYRKLAERLEEVRPDEASASNGAAAPPAGGANDARAVEDEMRLAATNLFLTGSSREEVAAYLEETFGRTDTNGLLEEFQPRGDRAGKRKRFLRKR